MEKARARLPAGGLGQGPSPLYAGVKQMIVARIASGEWQPHHRIPSENELVEQLGVSRMTINRALRELSSEGVLVRVQGVGTFVAEAKGHSALFEVRSIADEIAARGHVHTATVIAVQERPAEPDIARWLEVPPGTPVYQSLVVHRENDVPVQIEDRHVNPAAAPDYLAQDLGRVTANHYLMRVAPLEAAEHFVEAVLPSAAEAKLLAITRSEPCLMIRRRTWSGGRVVTAVRLLYPGGRYRLEGRQGAPGAAEPGRRGWGPPGRTA